jgi:hypothetical protein
MSQPHPINQTLLTLLDNQIARTTAAFEDMREETFTAVPGGDCKSIADITSHLFKLRSFQLKLIESSRIEQMPDASAFKSISDHLAALDCAAQLIRDAITEHDPDDWTNTPNPPREGMWGDLPNLTRLTRPFNDFTNHLGSIRAIRRILGDPAQQTQ